MPKYSKKPMTIEAIKYEGTPESSREIIGFTRNSETLAFMDNNDLMINSRRGTMKVLTGDYVIKGPGGDFFPSKPDIFEVIYEPAKIN